MVFDLWQVLHRACRLLVWCAAVVLVNHARAVIWSTSVAWLVQVPAQRQLWSVHWQLGCWRKNRFEIVGHLVP